MTALEVHGGLSQAEARSLTDEVKQDSERLWRKLVELYDGGAHLSLGYSSWGAYFKTEFGQSERHGYRLLDAGRALEIVASDPRVTDQLVTESPSGGTPLPNESQARALAPLLDQPEVMQEVWAEVSAAGDPTAKQTREVVQRKLSPPQTDEERQAAAEKQIRWCATMNVLDGLLHFDRPAVAEQAEREAAVIDQFIAASRGETVTPERLRRASAWAALLADALERTLDA